MSFFRKILGLSKRDRDEEKFLASVEKGVKQMQEELNLVMRTSADAMSHHNRIESEYQKYLRQAGEWKERAREALSSRNEELARTALQRKAECERKAEAMKSEVDEARQSSQRLSQQITQLKQRIAEAERDASTLVARKHAANAQKRLADSMAGLGSSDCAFSAIASYEDQVVTRESTASVLDNLDAIDMADVVDDKSSAVEDELAALKREMK